MKRGATLNKMLWFASHPAAHLVQACSPLRRVFLKHERFINRLLTLFRSSLCVHSLWHFLTVAFAFKGCCEKRPSWEEPSRAKLLRSQACRLSHCRREDLASGAGTMAEPITVAVRLRPEGRCGCFADRNPLNLACCLSRGVQLFLPV